MCLVERMNWILPAAGARSLLLPGEQSQCGSEPCILAASPPPPPLPLAPELRVKSSRRRQEINHMGRKGGEGGEGLGWEGGREEGGGT